MSPEQGSNENQSSDKGDRNREVHRRLKVTTPMMKGPDVTRLQDKINDWMADKKLPLRVKEDGEFGPRTLKAAQRVGWLMGLTGDIENNELSEAEQDLIRHPEKRSKEQRERSEDRVEAAQKARDAADHGAAAAIKAAMSFVGHTESPPSSNRSSLIDAWTRYCNLNPPVYWCGCFAGTMVHKYGGAKVIPSRLVHHQDITNQARAGVNGLEAVPYTAARKGDIVTFTFEHIALVREDGWHGHLKTVEGNTSPGSAGSQSNGGGVFARERSSGILQVCRVTY